MFFDNFIVIRKCEIEVYDIDKNLEQKYIFRTKLAMSQTGIVSAGILSTDISLNFFVDKHTDRFSVSRTNSRQLLALICNVFILGKYTYRGNLYKPSYRRKGAQGLLVEGSHINLLL